MVILGIDPGLRSTGWGLIKHSSGPNYINCGVIEPKTTLPAEERLLALHNGVLEIIEKYEPKEIALEKVFVNTNGATTLKLGEARGVILMTPAKKGLKVAEYAPNTIKKTITGIGHATKEQVQKMVQLILAQKYDFHKKKDATDALAIALCHYYYLRL